MASGRSAGSNRTHLNYVSQDFLRRDGEYYRTYWQPGRHDRGRSEPQRSPYYADPNAPPSPEAALEFFKRGCFIFIAIFFFVNLIASVVVISYAVLDVGRQQHHLSWIETPSVGRTGESNKRLVFCVPCSAMKTNARPENAERCCTRMDNKFCDRIHSAEPHAACAPYGFPSFRQPKSNLRIDVESKGVYVVSSNASIPCDMVKVDKVFTHEIRATKDGNPRTLAMEKQLLERITADGASSASICHTSRLLVVASLDVGESVFIEQQETAAFKSNLRLHRIG